jgi:3-deoxy-D-manno-octulosonic-acid transferase
MDTPRDPVSLSVYRVASALLTPAVRLMLILRRWRGKEDPERVHERRGLPALARPAGPLVWLHGASVGEVVSLLPIVAALTAKGVSVLVTSGTVNSAKVAAARLPAGVLHQFVPVDVPAFAGRFLDHWRPDLALFAESELWPNLIVAAHRRGTRLGLINARVSARSYTRWRQMPRFIKAVLRRFDIVLAQSEADADRLRELGATAARSVGNLKFDVDRPPVDERALAELRDAVGDRPVLIAASTHPDEELQLAGVHKQLKKIHPDLLSVIAPRHPERGPALAESLSQMDLIVRRRATGNAPDRSTDVYLADTIGELGLLYCLAPIVFMGGSLVERGGQNPIEPAKFGVPTLHGPHVFNFRDVYQSLDLAGASRGVADADDLAHTMARLLDNPAHIAEMAKATAVALDANAGATDRTMSAMATVLAGLPDNQA